MTRAEAETMLAQHAHHPSVTPVHLQKRRARGMPLTTALAQPVKPHPKRWASIGLAIEHYLRTQQHHSPQKG